MMDFHMHVTVSSSGASAAFMGAAILLLQGRPPLPPVAEALCAVETLQLMVLLMFANDDLGGARHGHFHFRHMRDVTGPRHVVRLGTSDMMLPAAVPLLALAPHIPRLRAGTAVEVSFGHHHMAGLIDHFRSLRDELLDILVHRHGHWHTLPVIDHMWYLVRFRHGMVLIVHDGSRDLSRHRDRDLNLPWRQGHRWDRRWDPHGLRYLRWHGHVVVVWHWHRVGLHNMDVFVLASSYDKATLRCKYS